MAGSVSHIAYGAALGTLFGALVGQRRVRGITAGLPFGLAVWYGNYSQHGLLARLGALPPHRKAIALAHQLVFGVTVAALYSRLSARRLDLSQCTVFITGGSRGLGLELARVFLRHGGRVAICARDAAELDRARGLLGHRIYTFRCDVTDPAQVAATVAQVQSKLGPIDVLVNNAGIITVGPFASMHEQDFAEALDTHFWGPLRMIDAVLPTMRNRKRGRIVNIASIGGKISVPHLLPYSASKFALVGLSEGLRSALARDGVIVTTVCPGLMRTGSPRNVRVKGQHRREYAWFALSDALPGMSINAARAARRIVRACQYGDAEIVLGLPARLAALAHAVAPNATDALLELATRLLPDPPIENSGTRRGFESESTLAPSALTALSDNAARRNNEVS